MRHGSTEQGSQFSVNSVFIKTSALIGLAATIVAVAMSVGSARMASTIATNSVKSSAHQVTGFVSEQASGALRFGKADALKVLLDHTITNSQGNAVLAVALNASGETLATAARDEGSAPAEAVAALQVMAQRAIETGKPVTSGDGMLSAYPAVFGDGGAVAGAVATQWSTQTILASIQAEKQRSFVLAASLLVTALVISAILLRATISVPLGRVRQVMAEVGHGNLDADVPMLRRRDEIGGIARTLNDFRLTLADARVASEVALFKSAGFEGASAAMLLLGADAKISHMNPACADLIAGFSPSGRLAAGDWVGKGLGAIHPTLEKMSAALAASGGNPANGGCALAPLICWCRPMRCAGRTGISREPSSKSRICPSTA